METQKVLPSGTVQEVKDEVYRNIEALSSDGGFAFNMVHHIQAEVPFENMAMWETLQKNGKY